MTAILGVSAFYHDSAAALLVDGDLVAAAQEERFTRRKHDEGFPHNAIEYCLEEAGLAPQELDYVGFYDKPLLKFERLLQTYVAYAPWGLHSFLTSMPVWLKEKLHTSRQLSRGLGRAYRRRFVFAEHHESHAASAFFPSPFESAAILTLDGVGEWATGSLGRGRGNKIELYSELRFPHSLGLLYSAFTYFCGFKVNSGEYKLMGLAPYGEPVYTDLILERLMDLKGDGSFRLDMNYFNYCQGLTMTSRKFHDSFGGPPREPEAPITQREMDIAASVQQVTEEVVLRSARHVRELTGEANLCMAGGVALNCVANSRIVGDDTFERLWVQPAAGDAGGALGVAYFIWHQLLDSPRTPDRKDAMKGALVGSQFGSAETRSALERAGAVYHVIEDERELCEIAAGLIVSGRVLGWFQGRMEFGPRALGSRSILGDPRDPKMQSLMNLKVKFRESFRPFAPAVLAEHAGDWFECTGFDESPYMLLTAPVSRTHRTKSEGEERGLAKLTVLRSDIPAVTHVDCSARLQTVDRDRHGRFHLLLERFWAKTGCPALINTSFNVRGEPIVRTPEDAYRCFMATDMDALVIADFLLLKEEQLKQPRQDVEEYLAQFELD